MSEKKVRTKRQTDDYSGLSAINHVYKISDTYVGSDQFQTETDYTMNIETGKFEKKPVKTIQAVVRLFLEIISNAADNVDASRRANVDPGGIEVTANETQITIRNGGLHIPVKKIGLTRKNGNTEVGDFKEGGEWKWLPAFIFGEFRSSNNYDETVKRMGCGRNGFGAKLANIFSKLFVVTVEDPDTKLRFVGTWKDNMFKDVEGGLPETEVTKDETIEKGSVSVTWELDFDRFKMKNYTKDFLDYFARITVDFSFTCKIKTYFNGIEFDYRSIREYAKLLLSEEEMENTMIQYVWEKDAPEALKKARLETQEKKILEAKKPEHIPEVEIMIIDTPDASKVISYVNGLITAEGGVHVDAAQEPIFKAISTHVNKEKKLRKSAITISAKNVRPHLSFIVNARLADPRYTSQSKTKLAHPSVPVSYSEKNLKSLQNWSVIQRMFAEMDAIASVKASKTDGNKKKHITMQKGEDANLAGTKESQKCTIYLCDGVSAANYPQKRICMLKGGKDYNGYMPLKGKFLNVTQANSEKYADNIVIGLIKQVLGLKEDLDYNLDSNIKTLRYGFIVLTVDADDDGMHILAHVLNFFREKFPGIIKRNMIGYLRTPVIKVMRGDKISRRFFNVGDFEKWREKNSTKGMVVRYFKGLGTSNDDDIKDDLTTAPTVICFHDSECERNMDLAFHRDNADHRKAWIKEWRDAVQCDDVISVDIKSIRKTEDKLLHAQDISQFINRELVGYSVASLYRAIPSEYDHLKDSQRKALYAALSYFNYDPKKGKSIKVGRFANKAADLTQYHHGEKSLIDTFIKMAQDFIGSNNMGYFKKDGQFGTRADGGENAADARYSETHLAWWIPLVYQKESVELIEKRVIEDDECEPLWLPGVIPMGIVNGTLGIATAYSTSTPCHNPFDVIKWYQERCKGNKPKPIPPWYNGFTGKMKIVNRGGRAGGVEVEDSDDDEENELLPGELKKDKPISNSPMRVRDLSEDELDQVDQDSLAVLKSVKGSKMTLKTIGKYDIIGVHKNDGPIIKVTEIPVRSWIHYYRKWLEMLVQDKRKPIFDFKDNSTTEKPEFIIHWNTSYRTPNHKSLRLERSMSLTNITLIDHKGFPERYECIQHVMERYFEHMIGHYNDVRNHRISCEEKKMTDVSFKMKFIIHVLKGDIVIIKVKEDVIREKMEEFEIPFEYYEKSKSRDFSMESVAKCQDLLEESKAKLELARKTTAEEIWMGKLATLEKELKKRYIKGVLYMKK